MTRIMAEDNDPPHLEGMATRERVPLQVLPSAPHADPQDERAAIEIYRPFFLAGIFTVLTVGCLLGAAALLGIARQGSYTASEWTPYVLAHANSQLFGWVGFFVMGFSLQHHAPPTAKVRAFHRLAYASLGAMATGIALRFLAEPLARSQPEVWVPVGVGACLLQLAAVAMFLWNSGGNRFAPGAKATWPTTFVFASLGWLLIIACVEPYVFAMTHQADVQSSIQFVAKWFVPLREAQFAGFVAMMIFGVSLSKFGSCFGFRKSLAPWGLAGFGLWLGGLIARMAGWIVYYDSGLAPSAPALYLFGGWCLALGAGAVIVSLGVFEPLRERYRSQKFLRGAFAWLFVAGLLMALEPVHLSAVAMPFSHAYTGAIRHALTVGFISQTILGVSLHMATRMAQLDESRLTSLWLAFWLLNLGNAARVGLEIATDYSPGAFLPMGVTGFVELAALLLWATEMARVLLNRKKPQWSHAR